MKKFKVKKRKVYPITLSSREKKFVEKHLHDDDGLFFKSSHSCLKAKLLLLLSIK